MKNSLIYSKKLFSGDFWVNLIIREPKSVEEFEKIEEIQKSAWGMKDIDVVPHRIIIAIHKAGGNVYLAFLNDEPVGFVLGFIGLKNGKLFLHSHQLGVKREYWGKGIGYQLKLKQREFALSNGINLVRWTFDPLLSRNAHLNFYKLGVINNTYLINVYGEMRDALNYGMPSDRFYVEWWVDSKRVVDRINGIKPPKAEKLLSDGVKLINDVTFEENNVPIMGEIKLNLRDKLLLLEIPYDFESVKKISLKKALDWRLKSRKIFQTYFNRGYVAVDFLSEEIDGLKRSFYILFREEKERVLNSNWWELV